MVKTGSLDNTFDQNDYRTPIVHCGEIIANQFSFHLTFHALHMLAVGMLSVGGTFLEAHKIDLNYTYWDGFEVLLTSTAHLFDVQACPAVLGAQVGKCVGPAQPSKKFMESMDSTESIECMETMESMESMECMEYMHWNAWNPKNP